MTALAFAGLRSEAGGTVVEIETLRRWLDSWRGIGDIAVGMAYQGYDLQLTRYYEQGWRATFYTSGIAHSVVKGSAWERTPWQAVRGVAWPIGFLNVIAASLT